ncbi:uncharacterized protein LOC130013170 [Patella vulgata]|uniref:uncharacterized protein LOC130013170 n=1 Tax=Patella vulgata TaxID=6465 RepID=UPI0024A930BB|nr:uncharacterized protein LOC130013170 [Patella vulgata]
MTVQWILVFILCSIASVSSYGNQNVNTTEIKKIHLIFMNHLDVGYDGLGGKERGLVNNVLNKYFQVYFPRAIKLSETLIGLGYRERFIYTTHPWLVQMYVNCPPNLNLSGILLQCPSAKDLQNFYGAVARGDITWHAGPMNMQYEMMDRSLIEFSLQLSDDLDEMFKIQRKYKTVSQRDVPGMSKALLPIFASKGIVAITVGVNPMSAPPGVPDIFNWQYQNKSLIAMWHPGGYPQAPGTGPGKPGGMSKQDCVMFPGFPEVMCFAFRTDNSGPPVNISEILTNYEIARGQFPNAVVQASTFDEFVEAVQPIKSQLPVVTKEIGDTWIQGPGSDPRKIAEMRAYSRLRTQCIEQGPCSVIDKVFYNSSIIMTKLGEHTWGIDSLFDGVNWSNQNFNTQLKEKPINYKVSINSWTEQREFTYLSLETLGDHPLVEAVKKEFSMIKAQKPDLNGYVTASISDVQKCENGFKFQFDKDGCIISLVDPITGTDWASTSNRIGQFIYQTYNQSDFTSFESSYSFNGQPVGIGKFNMSENFNASSQDWPVVLKALYKAKDRSCDFLVNSGVMNSKATTTYGAPRDIWVQYSVDDVKSGVSVVVQWFDKPPTRLPEAIFFSFQPVPQSNDHHWFLHKLDQLIDPLDVVINGSQRHHAIDKGVVYVNKEMKGMEINSVDAAIATVLTSSGSLSTLPLPLTPLKDVTGMSFNLFNNVWDVNWIFWYPYLTEDKDQKFRFNIQFA